MHTKTADDVVLEGDELVEKVPARYAQYLEDDATFERIHHKVKEWE